MATTIRLRRTGKKKAPSYRIVVADSRYPRDGRFVDDLGFFDPMTEPVTVKIDASKAEKWLASGAQPSQTVKSLLVKNGLIK